MSLFGDFYFFGILAMTLLPAIVLGIMEKNIKYYGFFLTIFFLVMIFKDSPMGLVHLGIYCVYEMAIIWIWLLITKKKGRVKSLYWLAIALAILPLTIWKISSFQGHGLMAVIGLSYMTFKVCQMIIEIYDGLIESINPFDFVYFLTFFPAITSGPIDRSRRFKEDLDNTPTRAEYLDMLGTGLFKVSLGIFYKFVLAAGAYQAETWLGKGDALSNHIIDMYTYGLYLFFDFAGYSLMAVGVSYILGVRCPDNFNKPFISTDMKDFWDRWHMTLSYWFRDFIFSRFMMKSIKGKWFKNKLTGASIGFIINMTIMGVWHGLDIYYIMYGLYHGILLALTEIYQKKVKFHKKNKKKRWYKILGIVITFNLAMFGFYIFSGKFTELIGLTWGTLFN